MYDIEYTTPPLPPLPIFSSRDTVGLLLDYSIAHTFLTAFAGVPQPISNVCQIVLEMRKL